MTSAIKWLWRSGILPVVATAVVWAASLRLADAAPYLPVTGPAPLREAALHPACILTANPPLVLDSSNPRFPVASSATAGTNAAAPVHPALPPAPVPAVAAEEPRFEYEPVVARAASAEPAVALAVTNATVVPVVGALSVPQQPLTPQMLLPMLLARPHRGGARGDMAVVVPVDFQPPAPMSHGQSSATYHSK
jgi:hypothetical protein